jgi:hypothetical protein
MATQFSISVIFKAADRMTAPIKRMNRSFKSFVRIAKAGGTAAKILGRRLKETADKMRNVGRTMSTRLTLPIVAFGALSLRTAVRFRAAMNFVQGVTRATGEEFKKLEKLALKLGRTTQFTAIQSAEAMLLLSKAGFSVEEVIKTLPRVLELAGAAQIDLGEAASIVTGVMGTMQLKAEEMGAANDVLTNAFTKSRTVITGIGEAFKRAGASIKTAGLSFKDITSLFQALGEVELRGGVAGRGLNRFITLLGKLRGAKGPKKTILENLGIDVNEFFTAEGKLIDIVKIIRAFEKSSIDLFAIAARLLATQMKGLPGTFKRFVSVFETLQIKFVKTRFGIVVQKTIDLFSKWIGKLADANPKLLEFIIVIGALLASIGPLLIGLALLTKAFSLVLAVPFLLVFGKWIIIIGILTAVIVTFREELENLFDFISGKSSLLEKLANISSFVANPFEQFTRRGVEQNTFSPAMSNIGDFINKSASQVLLKIQTEEGLNARVQSADGNVNVSQEIDLSRGPVL